MDKPNGSHPETVGTQAADPASLAAENATLRDQYLRALADAENERRRSERQVRDARNYAVTQFARELLPVADNLQRAIAAADGLAVEDAALLDGIKATERVLATAFENFGVRKVPAVDGPFDPAQQEAVMQVDTPDVAPGTVMRVLEDGYTIHDRLLRPARVVVAKRPAAEAMES